MKKRNNMKKLLIILFTIVCFSCVQYSYIMRQTLPIKYNKNQIDSICCVENIPMISNDMWICTPFIEDSTNVIINQYSYISRYENYEKTYLCTQMDSVYIFSKRELQKIKKE